MYVLLNNFTMPYKYLHFTGGTVHLVCRSEQRGKEAQESIIKETKNDVRNCNIYLMLYLKSNFILESPFAPC